MKNLFLPFFIILFISGCNLEEAQAIKDNASTEKVWAFIQFNVPLKDDEMEDYYYYGAISKPLYTSIKNNTLNSGFILMDDVKYWGNDDLIHEYADGENVGEIIFRIEDIRKIELVNTKPVVGKGSEQFEEEKPVDVPNKANSE